MPALLQALQDSDERVLRVAIQALWHISPERVSVESGNRELEKFCQRYGLDLPQGHQTEEFFRRYGLEPFSFFEPQELPQIVAEILRKNGLGPDQALNEQSH